MLALPLSRGVFCAFAPFVHLLGLLFSWFWGAISSRIVLPAKMQAGECNLEPSTRHSELNGPWEINLDAAQILHLTAAAMESHIIGHYCLIVSGHPTQPSVVPLSESIRFSENVILWFFV